MKSDILKKNIFGKTSSQIKDIVKSLDLPSYTASQICDWLYKKEAQSFDQMTNLSKKARGLLKEKFEVKLSPPVEEAVSKDGTVKYLFPVQDGKFVEAVYIPETHRSTLCLSTQVGCKMGCVFCMTGQQGFSGNLSAGEILNQYRSLPQRAEITNIVYMGMGEPLDNLNAVINSVEVFSNLSCFAISPKRITVSTIGMMPALKKLLLNMRCNLAISLHSPYEEERKKIMPVEQSSPLNSVLKTLKEHKFVSSSKLSIEYLMLDGINDSLRHANKLIKILHGLRCRVNLIHYHNSENSSLKGSPEGIIKQFQDKLNAAGMFTSIRKSRGKDIEAACGMLSIKKDKK